jgi:MFS family permease
MSARLRWTIVGVLCLGMMIAYFDRVNLSMAVAEKDPAKSITASLHLTDRDRDERGPLHSAFFFSYAPLQIPAGWVVDHFGVRTPFALGFLFWGLISAGTALARSTRQVFLFRLLLGVGEAVVTPAGMRWIRFHCAENQRGLAVGLYMAAAKVGPGVGAPIAAWLIGAYGWRTMFVILGLGSLIWLAPWLKLVKDDDRMLESAQVRKTPAASVPFGTIMASPVIWGTIVGTFCYQYFVYFCMTWLPTYFSTRWELDLKKTGILTMSTFLGMAVVATLAGWAADRLIDRGGRPVLVRKAFTIAGFLLASTQLIGPLSGSRSVALFFAVFSLSALGLMTANYWALTQTLIPGAAVGRIVGIQNCAANVPGIVAPLLTGWLLQAKGSYVAPMLAIEILLLTGATAYLFLVREKYAPKRT